MRSDSSSLWIVLLLAVVGGAIGWFWLMSDPTDDWDAYHATEAELSSTGEGADSPEAEGSTQGAPSVETVPFGESAALPFGADRRAQESFVVRVRRGSLEGDQVGEAVIHVVDCGTAEFSSWLTEHGGELPVLELVQEFGVRHVADQNGEARIGKTESEIWLHAQSGRAHAVKLVYRTDQDIFVKSGVVLALEDYIPISVRVVGKDSKPRAGAGVEFAVKHKEKGGWGSVELRTTDRKGYAHFPRALLASETEDLSRYSVALGLPNKERPRKVLTVAACEGEKIDLMMPPSSSCTVKVQLADGSRLIGPAAVRLLEYDEDGPQKRLTKHLRHFPATPVRHGRARLHYLTPGKSYVVALESGLFGAYTTSFIAPAFGSSTEVVLRLSPDLAGYLIRLVDINQQAMSSSQISCSIRGLTEEPRRIHTQVFKDGIVFIKLRPDLLGDPKEISLEILIQHPRSAIITHGTVITAPLPGKGAILDLGTVTLKPPPILVSGSVVDSDGTACPGAEVVIEPAEAEHEKAAPEDPTTLIVDAHGRWEHRGFFDPKEFRASAGGQGGHRGPEQRFSSHRSDVRLIAGGTASFSSIITMPGRDGWENALEAWLWPTFETDYRPSQELHPMENPEQLRLSATQLKPGPHSFALWSKFDGRLLYKVSDLDIPINGKITHDIALPYVFRSMRVRVQDRMGMAIRGAEILCVDPSAEDDNRPTHVSTNPDGEALVITTRDSHRIMINTPRHITQTHVLTPSASPITLDLRPKLTLRSKSIEALQEHGPGRAITLHITETQHQVGIHAPKSMNLRYVKGQTVLTMPRASELLISASFGLDSAGRRIALPAQAIQVSEHRGDLSLRLEWPREAIQEVIQRLGTPR